MQMDPDAGGLVTTDDVFNRRQLIFPLNMAALGATARTPFTLASIPVVYCLRVVPLELLRNSAEPSGVG